MPSPTTATAADLVLVGGDVITMDPARPRASAVAVRGGRIAAVGADSDVRALVGPTTQVIDLGGHTVTPGLVDGHAHLRALGAVQELVALQETADEAAAADKVAAAAAALPAGEWVRGHGWDQTRWPKAEFPTRRSLDALLPDRPAALSRIDGHAVWVNGAALAAAGIGRDTPDPPGGRILRDARGEPTGVLLDAAAVLVDRGTPPPTDAVRERQILAGAAAAVALGLTGVHEMGGDPDTVAAYRRLAAAGRLPLRVYAYYRLEADELDRLAAEAPQIDDGDDFFALRGIKLFADGALGSRGAALLAPYSDDPSNRGLLVSSPEALGHAVDLAVEHGWQVAVHAIGDQANRVVLDAYERALARHPGADLRLRVEHAQVVSPDDLPRFGRLGVIASMQPVHCTSDMRWAEARLGPARVRGAYAWRSVLAGGGRLIGGSDFPYDEASPLVGIYAAVTRQDAAGEPAGGWYPDQRLGLDEAIRIYTVEPAYGAFVEGARGRIAPGMVADLTVFDRALAADRSLLATRADLTIVGGRVVYSRPR